MGTHIIQRFIINTDKFEPVWLSGHSPQVGSPHREGYASPARIKISRKDSSVPVTKRIPRLRVSPDGQLCFPHFLLEH